MIMRWARWTGKMVDLVDFLHEWLCYIVNMKTIAMQSIRHDEMRMNGMEEFIHEHNYPTMLLHMAVLNYTGKSSTLLPEVRMM